MAVSQQKDEHDEYDVDADVESRQGLLSMGEVKTCSVSHDSPPRPLRWMVIFTLVNLILFSATVILFSKITFQVTEPARPMNEALKETFIYSPVLSTMEINMVRTRMNGSVWRTLDTPWNGEPDDPIKEAIWDDFNNIRVFPITQEEIVKMGQDPSIAASLDDAHWHLGEGKYIGALDIFHQIHCLDYVRKAALKGSTTGARVTGNMRLHTIHCVDMLMQHLLCTGDMGVLTYNWYEGIDIPQPNFSVDRKCIDWRQLVEYRDTHAAPSELWASYRKPAGDREIHTGDV